MKREHLPLAYLMSGDPALADGLLAAIEDVESRGGLVIVDNTHFRVLRRPSKPRQRVADDRSTDGQDRSTGPT